jgi:hypothetical protein
MRSLFRTAGPADASSTAGRTADVDASVKPWTADVLVGVPLGLRVEGALNPQSQCIVSVEGVIGTYLIFPTAGVGLRWSWRDQAGPHSSFQVRPGVDLYGIEFFFPFDRIFTATLGVVTVDLEAVWRHAFGEHLDGELGLKLGGGVAFANGACGFLPIAGIFGGFRF